MALMLWTDELMIGIGKVDEQHRWLVDRINALDDELARPAPDRKTIGEILDALVGYTMNHFILEEELFQRHGYPGSDAHRAEHNGFTGKLVKLLERFEAGGADVGGETLALLRDWLTHHILVVDKAYAPYLKSKGVR